MSILIKIFVIMLITALTIAASAAPQADILVRPSSDVTTVEVKLSDLASVNTNDKALSDKLCSAVVCRAPLAGSSRKLTRDQILTAIRRQGVTDRSVNIVCPQEFYVTRTASIVTGQAMFDTVQAYILESTNWPGPITVEPVRLPPDVKTPTGSLELKVKAGSPGARKGRGSLPVEIVVDGSVYTTVSVSFTVRVFANVLVATQSIGRFSPVTSDNTTLEEREITTLPDDVAMTAPSDDVIASLPIMSGSIIRNNWLTTPPAIKTGDIITVLVSGKNVRVSDKGAAVSDGHPGDRIKVRLGSEEREVRATVVKPGLVEIILNERG